MESEAFQPPSEDDRDRLNRVIDDSLGVIEKCTRLLELDDRVAALGRCRSWLEGMDAEVAADEYAAGKSDRQVARLLARDGRSSAKASKTRAKRGRAVEKNPSLGSRMRAGKLSGEQTDLIAGVADKTDGAAVLDEDFIEKIATVPPDQGRKIADEYVREHTDQDDVDSAYRRARRNRCVRRYENAKRGTDVLAIEGSSEDIDEIEAEVNALADRLYRRDGGRDVPKGKHVRTRDQRRFDAAMLLLLNQAGSGSSDANSADANGASTPTDGGGGSDRQTTFFVRATVEQLAGLDHSPLRKIGGGVLPATVVERLACNSEFVAQIYNQVGELLWQGRAKRYPTPAQVRGLIARDQECVLCGAHHSRCQAHHLDPWNAPVKGKTNIDRMALVCTDCHQWIHESHLTLYFDRASKSWKTRPATTGEIAHRKPRSRPETAKGKTTDEKSNSPPTFDLS